MYDLCCGHSYGCKKAPMQLTALRASLQHKSFRRLGVRWRCQLTPVQSKQHAVADAKLPDYTGAAFRDSNVAKEWADRAVVLE